MWHAWNALRDVLVNNGIAVCHLCFALLFVVVSIKVQSKEMGKKLVQCVFWLCVLLEVTSAVYPVN